MPLHKDGHATGKRPRHHLPRWAILFYFPQECPIELGPTCLIPGNQYLKDISSGDLNTRDLVPDPQGNGTFLLPDTFTNRHLTTLEGELGDVSDSATASEEEANGGSLFLSQDISISK